MQHIKMQHKSMGMTLIIVLLLLVALLLLDRLTRQQLLAANELDQFPSEQGSI